MNHKYIVILAAWSALMNPAFAQYSSFDAEIDSELEQISGGNAGSTQQAAPNSQPIYIQNQVAPTATAEAGAGAYQQNNQVQKQPQVDILAAPLSKSRAEQMRDARQQVEVETENRIAEKLEMSRIEDEKRRANVLFGDRFDTMNQAPQPVQVAPVAPVAPQAVVPVAPVAPVENEVDDRELIREEIRAAMNAEKELPIEKIERNYFGAILGIGDYPDVRNVKGNYLVGASFGTKFDETYAVEGIFTFSNYSVEPIGWGFNPGYGMYVPRLVDAQQYSGALAMKYYFFDGAVKPVVGGLAQYSYRTFGWGQDPYSGYYGYNQNNNGGNANSHAIDIGVVVGADVDFKGKWSLGLDFKYMWNLASRVNTNNQSMFLTMPQFGTPIEKLQYYTLNIVGKVNF